MILVVGDSLSAAYGIELSDGWVALLQKQLTELGFAHKVVNASITGDTTAGGLARLDAALKRHRPEIVIVELGGNDGLRGISLSVVEANLNAMIERSVKADAQVALLGIRIPVNYGQRYAEKFHGLYAKIARQHELPLVDFFLEGVALQPALMQADGIHPNAAAQPRLLSNAWPAIEQALVSSCEETQASGSYLPPSLRKGGQGEK